MAVRKECDVCGIVIPAKAEVNGRVFMLRKEQAKDKAYNTPVPGDAIGDVRAIVKFEMTTYVGENSNVNRVAADLCKQCADKIAIGANPDTSYKSALQEILYQEGEGTIIGDIAHNALLGKPFETNFDKTPFGEESPECPSNPQ